jgi:gas vesicle protein
MEEKGRWGDRTLYFLLGGLVGATVALLFAPRSGEETREYLANKARAGADAIKDKMSSAKEHLMETRDRLGSEAKDMLTKGKEAVVREKEVISAAIEAGKQAYKEEKQAALKKNV